MIEWRPISEAPKDRKFIALSAEKGNESWYPFISACEWHPDAGFFTCTVRDPVLWIDLPELPDEYKWIKEHLIQCHPE
jgi:hypothetical protein